jgi:hypothetical protein
VRIPSTKILLCQSSLAEQLLQVAFILVQLYKHKVHQIMVLLIVSLFASI